MKKKQKRSLLLFGLKKAKVLIEKNASTALLLLMSVTGRMNMGTVFEPTLHFLCKWPKLSPSSEQLSLSYSRYYIKDSSPFVKRMSVSVLMVKYIRN